MTEFLLTAIGVLLIIIAVLALKVYTMRKAAEEIAEVFSSCLREDTHAPIDISSRDKKMRELARTVDRELKLLRRQRRQLANGDRELKTAMTNLSHDLHTPLTALQGYLELLEQEDMSDDAALYLTQIRDRAEALRELMEELFSYSAVTSAPEVSAEPVNLCWVLEDSLISFYGAFAQKGITPVISLPEEDLAEAGPSKGDVWRDLDPASLSRIFENIISNAVKYSDGDFTVTLTSDGTVTFSSAAAALSSVDTDKLFDRFYAVGPAQKSIGLRLSIAKLLTERMHGTIGAGYAEGRLVITVRFLQTEG
jgi:signal transduction histidine kinase